MVRVLVRMSTAVANAYATLVSRVSRVSRVSHVSHVLSQDTFNNHSGSTSVIVLFVCFSTCNIHKFFYCYV